MQLKKDAFWPLRCMETGNMLASERKMLSQKGPTPAPSNDRPIAGCRTAARQRPIPGYMWGFALAFDKCLDIDKVICRTFQINFKRNIEGFAKSQPFQLLPQYIGIKAII